MIKQVFPPEGAEYLQYNLKIEPLIHPSTLRLLAADGTATGILYIHTPHIPCFHIQYYP